MLPTFFVVGAAKAGTTSLYRYLGDHPDVFVPRVKEPFFFSFMEENPVFQGPHDEDTNESIVTDPDTYTRLFDNAEEVQERGDFSCSYVYFTRTAERIKEAVPDAKIIIMLRDPVRRAFSHHLQFHMLGHDTVSFEEALAEEKRRDEANWRWHYQLRDQSRYYEQVRQYVETFAANQVHILLFEDFVGDTRNAIKDVARFLDVDTAFYDDYDFTRHNATKLPKNDLIHRLFRTRNSLRRIFRWVTPLSLRQWAADFVTNHNYDRDQIPSLSEDVEQRLREEFRGDVERLEALIDRDLSMWKGGRDADAASSRSTSTRTSRSAPSAR